MKISLNLIALAAMVLPVALISVAPAKAATAPTLLYGGEEVPNGNPWHHYDITRRAAAGDICFLSPSVFAGELKAPARCVKEGISVRLDQASGETYLSQAPGGDEYAPAIVRQLYKGAGFSRDAALALAWHADWVDSYLYNPLWWAEDLNFKRAIVASASYNELAKVHFDDSFSIGAINDDWERYSSGALIGLNWAAGEWGRAHGDVLSLRQEVIRGRNYLSPAQKTELNKRLAKAEKRELDTLQTGFNIIGISMHALEDFYSHSTWMNNKDLRRTTWLELPANQRTGLSVMSGAYEKPISAAPVHHGDFAFACSFYNRTAVKAVLKPVCSDLSPVQNIKMCEMRRKCKDAEKVQISVYGEEFNNLLYLKPVGINLDNTVYAGYGGEKRGILRADRTFAAGQNIGMVRRELCPSIINRREGDPAQRLGCVDDQGADARLLFATSKDLAVRAVTQWLLLLEQEMTNTGNRAYWDALKTYKKTQGEKKARVRQYENYWHFPYQFMTAGPYPGSRDNKSSGYYLRLDIETSNKRKSGTDADIVVVANGQEFLLDYLPTAYDKETGEGRVTALQRAFTHNDFERGDRAVYTIGPFKQLPTKIRIDNRDAGGGDVFKAFGQETRDAFIRIGDKFKDGALTIIGGHADYVDEQVRFFERDELDTIIRNGGKTIFIFDGGKEGRFEFDVLVEKTSWQGQGFYEDWGEYIITIGQMRCIKESKRDRGSNSDEIFSLWTLSQISNDDKQSFRTKVFNDVDKGESRQVDTAFNKIRLPANGGIVLGGQVFESDDESGSDRQRLLVKFTTGVEQEVAPRRGRFIDAMARAIAPDWRVKHIKIIAFKRGPRPELGVVYDQEINKWFDGGSKKILLLSGGLRPLRSSPTLLQWTGGSVTLYDLPRVDIEDQLKNKVPLPPLPPVLLPGKTPLP
jgi:hypothetical protein